MEELLLRLYSALMTQISRTEIFVDERFVIPPTKLGITTVATPHSNARALDPGSGCYRPGQHARAEKQWAVLTERPVLGCDSRSLS